MLKHDEQQRLLEDILKRFDDDMKVTIANIERLINRELMNSGFTEASALKFDGIFNRALYDAGYFERVNEFIDNDFDEMYTLILSGINSSGLTASYTNDDLTKILALKNMQLGRFTNLAEMTGREIQQSLYKYALSDFSADDIQKQLKKDLEGMPLSRYTKTIARTSIKDFQEALIDMKAKDLEAVWIYVGVSDSKTRDYCNCILSKKNYFDSSTKSTLQGDSKRSYNCRHRFRPVSVEYALDSGYTKADGAVC